MVRFFYHRLVKIKLYNSKLIQETEKGPGKTFPWAFFHVFKKQNRTRQLKKSS